MSFVIKFYTSSLSHTIKTLLLCYLGIENVRTFFAPASDITRKAKSKGWFLIHFTFHSEMENFNP